jgi:hypothetical protein
MPLATEPAGVLKENVAIALEEFVQDNSRMWAAHWLELFTHPTLVLANQR